MQQTTQLKKLEEKNNSRTKACKKLTCGNIRTYVCDKCNSVINHGDIYYRCYLGKDNTLVILNYLGNNINKNDDCYFKNQMIICEHCATEEIIDDKLHIKVKKY